MLKIIFVVLTFYLNLFKPILSQDDYSSDLGNVLPQSKYDNCGLKVGNTEFPFLAAVGYNNTRGTIVYSNACDGVLINRLYVLTSASCHTEQQPIAEVILGEQNFENASQDCPTCYPPQKYQIKPGDVYVHQGYVENDKVKNGNDLALVRLPYLATTHAVNSQVPVMPICIAFKPEIALPTKFHTIAAWDRNLIIEGNFTGVVNRTVELIANETCQKNYTYQDLDYSRNICVGGPNATFYSCLGLPGSPLIVQDDDKYKYLHGLLSVQRRCGGGRDTPDLYVNIQNYINWIRDNIKR